MVTCQVNLFHNCFSLRRRPSQKILFQHLETCLELFQDYIISNMCIEIHWNWLRCKEKNYQSLVIVNEQIKQLIATGSYTTSTTNWRLSRTETSAGNERYNQKNEEVKMCRLWNKWHLTWNQAKN